MRMRTLAKTHTGFTLAELLVVIAIVAVLVAIAIPLFANSLSSSQKAACQANRRSLRSAYAAAFETNPNATEESLLAQAESACGTDGTFSGICPTGGTITYKLDGNGLMTFSCSDHPDETATGLIDVTDPQQILSSSLTAALTKLGLTSASRIDSTSGSADVKKVAAALEDADVDLDAQNIKSWAMVKEGNYNVLWWSDVDISTLSPGESVRVIRYNPNRNTYTAGYLTVQSTTSGGNTYNTLMGGSDFVKQWTEAPGQDATTKKSYSQTVTVFNSMAETK